MTSVRVNLQRASAVSVSAWLKLAKSCDAAGSPRLARSCRELAERLADAQSVTAEVVDGVMRDIKAQAPRKRTTRWAEFAAAVQNVQLAAIPVYRLDRCAPRTERARQARELFRRLGVRGVSVTAPGYSQAHSVNVRLPRPGDDEHDPTRWPHDHSQCCGRQTGHTDDSRCPACAQVDATRRKVEAILYAAFPNHRDRSEYESDHFDFCWSIFD